jgi:DNA-binding response OmpR family regulator
MLSQGWLEANNAAVSKVGLPITRNAAVRGKAARAKQKILIIEDDKSMHTLYKAILENPKIAFRSAYDGAIGLTMAESIAPNLILLDVDLPGITGFFICKYLKANPLTASIPVILISGLSSADDMLCGLKVKASDYVTKPIEENDLRNRVKDALHAAEIMEQLAKASAMLSCSSTMPNSFRPIRNSCG